MTSINAMAAQVSAYCARIGQDPLLVQGAGGNVSWKDDDLLWIKASGTWLAEAREQDIFVPVDLPHLRAEIRGGNFSVAPKVVGATNRRASIETLLHALMPHKVVVHLHAIEVLAHLVRTDAMQDIERLLGAAVKWVAVDYFKPGANLAQAVADQLRAVPDANVIFLKSHGVVIGGDSIEDVEQTLAQILSRLQGQPLSRQVSGAKAQSDQHDLTSLGYRRCADAQIHQLAIDAALLQRLQTAWALYPDHVVFLGASASIAGINIDLNALAATTSRPHFIFVSGQGVFESPAATKAHSAQLRCYYDVLVRQNEHTRLCTLSDDQVADLLDWDAEKYRQQLKNPQAGSA